MNHRISTGFAAAAAAAVIGLGAIAHAHPGHFGDRGGGDFMTTIAALKAKLNLSTSQQASWDSAVAAGKAARANARTNMQNVRSLLNAELAKAEPDLAAVAAAADRARTQNEAQRHQARESWLGLYATFSPDQKAIVKAAIEQRLARIDRWRARMKERHGQGG
ncbi:MAG: periplasmic heavy metal sensor [Betaproteobacteria bacterium]|nr:periplasmic heavy metal sensor [Betaproteobacteria bacterium]